VSAFAVYWNILAHEILYIADIEICGSLFYLRQIFLLDSRTTIKIAILLEFKVGIV
jgi:hypothetical protein